MDLHRDLKRVLFERLGVVATAHVCKRFGRELLEIAHAEERAHRLIEIHVERAVPLHVVTTDGVGELVHARKLIELVRLEQQHRIRRVELLFAARDRLIILPPAPALLVEGADDSAIGERGLQVPFLVMNGKGRFLAFLNAAQQYLGKADRLFEGVDGGVVTPVLKHVELGHLDLLNKMPSGPPHRDGEIPSGVDIEQRRALVSRGET